MSIIPTEPIATGRPDTDSTVDLDLRGDDVVVSLDPQPTLAPGPSAPPDAATSATNPARRRRLARLVPVAFWTLTFVAAGLLFLPTVLGYSRYAIVGGSMSGTFERGSAVFAEPVPVEDLVVGDVITFVPPPQFNVDTFVTHRIHDIDTLADGTPRFRTKGDANEDVDPWRFTLDQADQNVVRFAVPHLGHVLVTIADPDFRQWAIGVPAGLIALGAVSELAGVDPRRLLRRRPVAV